MGVARGPLFSRARLFAAWYEENEASPVFEESGDRPIAQDPGACFSPTSESPDSRSAIACHMLALMRNLTTGIIDVYSDYYKKKMSAPLKNIVMTMQFMAQGIHYTRGRVRFGLSSRARRSRA